MTRLRTINVGRRELTLEVEAPGELLLGIQWPTAVNRDALVMLTAEAARNLRDALSEWLGEDDVAQVDPCPLCPHPLHTHGGHGCTAYKGSGLYCACPRTAAQLGAR